ncbi:Reticulon-domain-containing protein [Chlamydoabsidia padenii]|nr:Reticulon-domain-containing protein [Chlamydoabsidia padenii]
MMDILSPSFTSGHKYTGKSNVTTATTPAEGIAPPSPRLSMDETTLTMLMEDKLQHQEINTTSVGKPEEHEQVDKPAEQKKQVDEPEEQVMPKPIIDTSIIIKNFPYQSPTDVVFANDPSAYLINQTKSLIYWEYPLNSAGVLFLTLGSIWLTRSYSLLYLASGLFTVVTFFNWMYVNLHFHSHRILSGKPADMIQHPHGDRLCTQKRRTWFTEDQVDHACQVMMDMVEGVVKQAIDLILIKDNKRSGCAVLISFMVWTLATLFSVKTMVMLFTVVAFVAPRLYLEHEELVDRWCQRQTIKARRWAQQHQAQIQTWLRQYHILGQHLVKVLTVVYQHVHRLALLARDKQQQWVKNRQQNAKKQKTSQEEPVETN